MEEEKDIPAGDREVIPAEQPVIAKDDTVNTELPTGPGGQTTNYQQQTEQEMEVHHHTHASHGKKTWKSYFWEFLMLFLAVFCGFLAEYQLEHVIEHQREKEFIKSMVEDLQNDHNMLNEYIANTKLGLGQMDSLVTMLDDDKMIKENGNLVYFFGRVSPRFNVFTNNSRTFDQLRNSGGFRLIRNSTASGKIMGYYGSLKFIQHLENLYFQEFDEYKKVASKIFDPAVFRSMETPGGDISREASNPALRTNDPEQLKELGIYAVYMNGSRRSIIPAAVTLQKNGDELIAYLKSSYHLE